MCQKHTINTTQKRHVIILNLFLKFLIKLTSEVNELTVTILKVTYSGL